MENESTTVRGATEVQQEGGRSARKRRAIIEEATALFLRNGYQGTSMDEVAARAAVSKQTVYKNFADKEQLFTEIIRGIADRADLILDELRAVLRAADATTGDDLERVLTDLAVRYLGAVLQPQVTRLRRLVIAEADRFPELAHYYFEKAQARAIQILGDELGAYAERGLLHLADPAVAAGQFAYLVLAIPQDKALFNPGEELRTDEHGQLAKEAVRIFLAAYR